MKKTRLIILIIVSVFAISILTPNAYAGSTQKHRWEGVAIGIGAAILGSALLNQHRPYVPPAPAPVYKAPPPPARSYYGGHWEIRKEWIPPTYKKVWNPGHYDKMGHWVEGHWIEIVDRPGCWEETKVWITRRLGILLPKRPGS